MKEKTHKKEERKPKASQDGGKAEAVEKEKRVKVEPTKKLACTCSSAFQDDTYGKGVRVFNRAGKGPGSRQYRCTVCKREVTV